MPDLLFIVQRFVEAGVSRRILLRIRLRRTRGVCCQAKGHCEESGNEQAAPMPRTCPPEGSARQWRPLDQVFISANPIAFRRHSFWRGLNPIDGRIERGLTCGSYRSAGSPPEAAGVGNQEKRRNTRRNCATRTGSSGNKPGASVLIPLTAKSGEPAPEKRPSGAARIFRPKPEDISGRIAIANTAAAAKNTSILTTGRYGATQLQFS